MQCHIVTVTIGKCPQSPATSQGKEIGRSVGCCVEHFETHGRQLAALAGNCFASVSCTSWTNMSVPWRHRVSIIFVHDFWWLIRSHWIRNVCEIEKQWKIEVVRNQSMSTWLLRCQMKWHEINDMKERRHEWMKRWINKPKSKNLNTNDLINQWRSDSKTLNQWISRSMNEKKGLNEVN